MADETRDGFHPTVDSTITFTRHAVNDQIGPFRLLQKLGEGGMGEVWLVEQSEPIRRKVALKIIKQGMDTAQVVARFEYERQALASMDHPNIAKVFDAGATETGRPYFVMEYVAGEPITTYCDRHQLTTRERLELFFQVCDGVQHAHRSAVIHRDIKPHNVLVAIQDSKPVPKLIDFGIAKATDRALTARTVFTEFGQLIGTPEYMSPEQAEFSALGVDTRTDIYSLGVLLYELLVGVLPLDSRELRRAGFDEIRRRIREEEPPRPSTRLVTLGAESARAAQSRRTSLAKLSSQLQGDLDWITMKALEKDRTRRYDSAAEFAADLRRHLANEPVVARPPSTLYRVRKFLIRHKLGVSFAAVVFLLTTTLAIAMSVQAARISAERDRANRQAVRAEQEAETARRTSQFLVELFEVSDPSESRGNSITAREILDTGAERIREELVDQPAIRAVLLRTVGSVYTELGLYQQAHPLLLEAVDLHDDGTEEGELELATSLYELAALYARQDEDVRAEALALRALEIRERRLGPDHPDVAVCLNVLGIALEHQGRLEEAMLAHERAVQIREDAVEPDHANLAASLHNLAIIHYFLNNLEEAEKLYKRSAEIEKIAYGTNNHGYATTLHTLAILYQDQGRLAEALEFELRATEIRQNVLGPDHFHVALSLTTLGNIYREMGNPGESEPYIRRALDIAEAAVGPDHGEVLWMRRSLAKTLIALERYQEAESLLQQSVQSVVASGEESRLPLNLNELAAIRRLQGDYREAERLYQRSADITRRISGDDVPELGLSLSGLANVHGDQRRYDEADQLYQRALALMENGWGSTDPDRLATLRDYASMLERAGRDSDAATAQAELDRLQK